MYFVAVGDDCQTDFDACTTNPCSFERNCTDTKAEAHKANPSLPAYTCTPCPAGFEDKTDKCEGTSFTTSLVWFVIGVHNIYVN